MKNHSLTDCELECLRKSLPHGTQKEIAEKLKVSLALVNQVLLGKTYSIRIINEALKHYEKVINIQLKQKKHFLQLHNKLNHSQSTISPKAGTEIVPLTKGSN